MSLRAEAEAALSYMLESTEYFGQGITITAPTGEEETLVGLCQDIGEQIDPQTGAFVSGRLVTVAIRLSTLDASTLPSIPRAIAELDSRPWKLAFSDVLGVPRTFKVRESRPDRTAGVLVLICEGYDDGA